MVSILLESPAWYFVFCLLAGGFFTWLLYRKDTSFNEFGNWLKRILITLRFLFITLLCFLLLTPLIKTIKRQTEKPIIILAQDNSQSIVINKDSAFYKTDYVTKFNQLVNDLSKKYDVKTVAFGDKVNDNVDFSFTEKQSDYAGLMKEMNVRYANRNIGGYVIAGDGLFNRGSSPLYEDVNPKAPLYSIALGDTVIQKDLIVGNVRYNKIVFLNNTFPIEINVNARQCQGNAASLTVKEDSTYVFSKTISITSNKFNEIVPVYLDAKKKGIHHYKILLAPLPNEVTIANNTKDVYIEVKESKEKVIIVADAPHPDISALKEAIESNQNYEVRIETVAQFPADIKFNDYQLVILHQIPSTDHLATDLLAKLKQSQTAVWFILGAESNVNAFNNLQAGVSIRNFIGKNNDVQPSVNPTFSSFTLSNETESALQTFPPLIAPFGEYKTIANGNDLLRQKIGSVSTDQPLLTFFDVGGVKNAVLCGEGLWRWKLNDYQIHNNMNAFNELITKTVQLLSTHENRSHLKVITKSSFQENEPVSFSAEVYNDNYELINTPDVSLTIINKARKSFPYTFSKTEKSYSLNAGLFAPGDYKYHATVKLGDRLYSADGEFNVTALQVEQTETVADHQLLYALAHKNGGQMFYPSQMDQLSKQLLEREDIKTVSYSETKLVDFVNLKWFFFLLLAFITAEWFLRKRNGGY